MTQVPSISLAVSSASAPHIPHDTLLASNQSLQSWAFYRARQGHSLPQDLYERGLSRKDKSKESKQLNKGTITICHQVYEEGSNLHQKDFDLRQFEQSGLNSINSCNDHTLSKQILPLLNCGRRGEPMLIVLDSRSRGWYQNLAGPF